MELLSLFFILYHVGYHVEVDSMVHSLLRICL